MSLSELGSLQRPDWLALLGVKYRVCNYSVGASIEINGLADMKVFCNDESMRPQLGCPIRQLLRMGGGGEGHTRQEAIWRTHLIHPLRPERIPACITADEDLNHSGWRHVSRAREFTLKCKYLYSLKHIPIEL